MTQTDPMLLVFNTMPWAHASQLSLTICFFILNLWYTVITLNKHNIRFTKISMLPYYLSLLSGITIMIMYSCLLSISFIDYEHYMRCQTIIIAILFMFWHSKIVIMCMYWHLLSALLIFQSENGVT